MKKVFLLLCCCAGLSAYAQLPKPAFGSIQRFENFASVYVPARNVDVWLPDSYDPRKKYAVLYMHDGQMLFDSTISWNHQEWGVDETLSRLLTEKKIRDCIVVGIWNGGERRHREYFPQKPFESLTPEEKITVRDALAQHKRLDDSAPGFDVQSDNYLKFLVCELKPFIDTHFSTIRNRQNTFIAGSSMGGLISLYAICEYPRVFGGAACLSTHWPGIFRAESNPIPDAFLRYLRTSLPDPQTHKIYFDYGSATLDSLYGPIQQKVDGLMRDRGFTSINWMTKYFPGENHSENAWQKRFDIPMDFLLNIIWYPVYDGMPIVWQGESYFGNIKSAAIFTEELDQKTNPVQSVRHIFFNEDWQVTGDIGINERGDTTSVTRPVFNQYGNAVVETILHPNGTLMQTIVHEFNQGVRVKSTEYSSFGTPSSVTEYSQSGDTIVAEKRYFNSLSKAFEPKAAETTKTVYANGRIIWAGTSHGGTHLVEHRMEYTQTDRFGNWTEAQSTMQLVWDGKLQQEKTRIKRKITYFDFE